MRYIVIGAGGMGGVIGGFLASQGREVALIARGAHLNAIQENGLILDSALKGCVCLKDIEAYAAEDDFAPGDAVFVCVKGYSLKEAVPVIAKAAKPGAVVIPILNSLKAGSTLQQALPQLTVVDGCIYTSAFIEAPGMIKHPGAFLRVVFGARQGQQANQALLEQIAADLNASGVNTRISPYIEGDMFKKIVFISTFASTDSYFDVSAEAVQKEGPPRQLMISLLQELISVGQAQGLQLPETLFADTLAVLDNTGPGITTSMHKDIKAGKQSETQELVFDVVEMAEEAGVPVPTYQKVAGHFGYKK